MELERSSPIGLVETAARAHVEFDFPYCAHCANDLRRLKNWPIVCPKCGATIQESDLVNAEILARRILVALSWAGMHSLFVLLLIRQAIKSIWTSAFFSVLLLIGAIVLKRRAVKQYYRYREFRSNWTMFICFMYGVAFGVECVICFEAVLEHLRILPTKFITLTAYGVGLVLLLARNPIVGRIRRSLCAGADAERGAP